MLCGICMMQLAFAQCLLGEDEVDAVQQGYPRSCCMVLMQALLLSPQAII